MSIQSIDVILDCQFGSTGKGLLAGYLAETEGYDTIITAWAPNAGHTYIDRAGTKWVNIAFPNGAVSKTVERVLLGPGSIIDPDKLIAEWQTFVCWCMANSRAVPKLVVHPHAAVVTQRHRDLEAGPMTKIGSTKKGVGEAAIQRIRRDPDDQNIASVALAGYALASCVVTREEYDRELYAARRILVEGAQGTSLSMYHGFYPYTTSRDVSTAQILADCGIPFGLAGLVNVFGTMRTFPIRVANRYDENGKQVGYSGPCYADQREMAWAELGREPELTTVTKLPRRIFSFSEAQIVEAVRRNGVRCIFLNFCNYLSSPTEVLELVNRIHLATSRDLAAVCWLGFGPSYDDVLEFDNLSAEEQFPEVSHWFYRAKQRGY